MKRIYFIANAVWGDLVGGGDIHFFELAKGAAAAGYEIYFLGGPALQRQVEKQQLPGTVILTENRRRPRIDEGSFKGQLQILLDYGERCLRSIFQIGRIGKNDVVYSVTDYWCDSIPLMFSRARRKAMVFHMEAPSLKQIIFKSRPDVEAGRLASLHYWLSQNLSLWLFRRCQSKHLFYLHPGMRGRLLDQGYEASELSQISYGVDTDMAEHVSEQTKRYDVCWIGRVHRQKGIDDLLATIKHLAERLPDFRALVMGKVEAQMRPRITALGLERFVDFSGFISESEKIRLFKSSRLFLMPSRHEGSPRVVGEALVCGVPVLAYDVPNYTPVFGDFVKYVPRFNLEAFKSEAERLIAESRRGESYLSRLNLEDFRKTNSWDRTRKVFLTGLQEKN